MLITDLYPRTIWIATPRCGCCWGLIGWVFTLDSFRRMELKCSECKPSLSAWPRHTLATSCVTQPHALPSVQHSSLTANRHNIYILHLRHMKKSCRLNMQAWEKQEWVSEREGEREYLSWERKAIQSRLLIIQRRMSWYHKSTVIEMHGIPINIHSTNGEALA